MEKFVSNLMPSESKHLTEPLFFGFQFALWSDQIAFLVSIALMWRLDFNAGSNWLLVKAPNILRAHAWCILKSTDSFWHVLLFQQHFLHL